VRVMNGLAIVVTAMVILAACSSSGNSGGSGTSSGNSGGSGTSSGNSGGATDARGNARAEAAAALKKIDANTPMGQTLDYIVNGKNPPGHPRVGFIEACTSNTYCQAGVAGARAAATQFGLDMKLYDSNFSSDTELKNTQDATQAGYQGYVLNPLASASGCAVFKLLRATGKPVENGNSPMCGNPEYTPGTTGFVAVQTTAYFQKHIEYAFATCTKKCDALVIDQGVESDLYKEWKDALKAAKAKYPLVNVVVDQPTDFVPEKTLQVTQDALQRHPSISMVVSYWDDATRGAEQAIRAAGKQPGKDVRIYSMGGTKDALAKVKAGTWNETTVLLPYEEGYYAFAQLARKLATGKDTPGYTDLAGAPSIINGPGSVFITADNADKFQPKY
jgi:ABC-type sugar transport system substrate-binding protein